MSDRDSGIVCVLWRRGLVSVMILLGCVMGTARFLLRPRFRRMVLERARVLLQGTGREGQHRAVAWQQSNELGVQWLLNRRFPLAQDTPILGLHHLDEARARGTGTILITAHNGWLTSISWLLARASRPASQVAGQYVVHSTAPSDRHRARMLREGERLGSDLILVGTGAYGQIEEIVARGEAVVVAVDMPGSLAVEYFGKPARLGRAAFGISFAAGAQIVPVLARRRRAGLQVEIQPPLDPAEFADVESYAQHVCDVLTESLLPSAGRYHPFTVGTLWPGGSAEGARPNRERWRPLADGSR